MNLEKLPTGQPWHDILGSRFLAVRKDLVKLVRENSNSGWIQAVRREFKQFRLVIVSTCFNTEENTGQDLKSYRQLTICHGCETANNRNTKGCGMRRTLPTRSKIFLTIVFDAVKEAKRACCAWFFNEPLCFRCIWPLSTCIEVMIAAHQTKTKTNALCGWSAAYF